MCLKSSLLCISEETGCERLGAFLLLLLSVFLYKISHFCFILMVSQTTKLESQTDVMKCSGSGGVRIKRIKKD